MSQADLLLVEDDQRLALLTQNFLNNQGFNVVIAPDGNTALSKITRSEYALVILDLNLPDIDGLTLCTELRRNHSRAIIMLTARDTVMDEIAGLDSGADDYLCKPVDPSLLVARIEAALRRQTEVPNINSTIAVNALSLNSHKREAHYGGAELQLGRLEFDLLLTLASRPDQVLSRDTLSQQTRGIPYDGIDRTIDIQISKLRKKLNDDSDPARKIKTVWGKGYILNSELI